MFWFILFGGNDCEIGLLSNINYLSQFSAILADKLACKTKENNQFCEVWSWTTVIPLLRIRSLVICVNFTLSDKAKVIKLLSHKHLEHKKLSQGNIRLFHMTSFRRGGGKPSWLARQGAYMQSSSWCDMVWSHYQWVCDVINNISVYKVWH